LQKNIGINKLEKHVKLSKIALGQQIGISKLFLSKNTPTSMATLNRMQSEYLEVPIDTLDNINFAKCIDLIKIDVEGFESKVFLGGKNTLERFKPIILAEALTQNELRNQQLVLTKYGYEDPIQVHSTSFSDCRNYIWFSKADEFKVNSYLSKARKEFINFKTR
jgi:FkbM family methyltransferase